MRKVCVGGGGENAELPKNEVIENLIKHILTFLEVTYPESNRNLSALCFKNYLWILFY